MAATTTDWSASLIEESVRKDAKGPWSEEKTNEGGFRNVSPCVAKPPLPPPPGSRQGVSTAQPALGTGNDVAAVTAYSEPGPNASVADPPVPKAPPKALAPDLDAAKNEELQVLRARLRDAAFPFFSGLQDPQPKLAHLHLEHPNGPAPFLGRARFGGAAVASPPSVSRTGQYSQCEPIDQLWLAQRYPSPAAPRDSSILGM